MSNTDLIKELRALTQAGMKDCKEALQEAEWDLQKAVDIVKVKGLNIADGRTGRVAAEGRVSVVNNYPGAGVMMEVNCQTDFVANSPDFRHFAGKALSALCNSFNTHTNFDVASVEDDRKAVVAITKENIVVRRWWVEEALAPSARVFSYVHSNNKIGVLLTLKSPDFVMNLDAPVPWNNPAFVELGNNLAMQVAAMSPLAISAEKLSPDQVDRQQAIFQTQLKELNKPQASWAKILEGKFRKWHTEVCLLEQEAVWLSKTSVGQAIKNVGTTLGGEVQVINFIRCQVGEGIEVVKDNLAEEVSKLM